MTRFLLGFFLCLFGLAGFGLANAGSIYRDAQQGTFVGTADEDLNMGVYNANLNSTGGVVYGSTSTGWAAHNQTDQTTNYEVATGDWSSNVYTITVTKAGTGTQRDLKLTGSGGYGIQTTAGGTLLLGTSGGYHAIGTNGDNESISINARATTGTNALFRVQNASFGSPFSASSGTQTLATFNGTLNQTGSAGYALLAIAATETATGSGTKNLIEATTGAAARFSVSSAGNATTVNLRTTGILADLTASCVTGDWGYDTGGATREICFCRTTNTWSCHAAADGPAD